MNALEDFNNKTTEELALIVQQLQKNIVVRDQVIESLRHQLNNALRHRFGKKSEKIDPRQASLFDEMLPPSNSEEILQTDHEITVSTYQRKKPGKKPIPHTLPRVQQIHDLSEEEKVCPCGSALTKIGDEITEQLDFIPAKVQVIQHVHCKYACKACEETIKTAKGPKHPIPKSIASPGLLAHVTVSKFCDHLPLYRQESILQRMGIEIARNTLAHWMIKESALLLPLYKLLQHHLTTYDIAYADETPVQVLKEPGRAAESKSYMWCFIGGPPEKRSVLYHYDQSRANGVVLEILEDFQGWLHCDGHSAYDAYAKMNPEVKLLACWMHCRRKFYEVAKSSKTVGLAHQAVKKIAQLYRIEETLKHKNASPQEIYEVRQLQAKPLLDEFKKWLDDNSLTIRPKSPLGEAVGYALNQWNKLIRYLQDGRLEMDNGLSERKIKPFVIGRKNWLFCDSVAGARAAEILYSIIETAKHHKVEPYTYLRYVLTHLPNASTEKEIEALLPFNIDSALIRI